MDNHIAEEVATTNPCKADFQVRRAKALADPSVTEVRGEFTRRVTFEAGYDHRAFPEACGGGGHGQHGMTVRFVLLGAAGATQFVFNLSHFVPGNASRGKVRTGHSAVEAAYAVDLGYHWPTPRYEGQTSFDCDVLAAGQCFYDGSGLNADPILEQFLAGGPPAVWAALGSYYRELQVPDGRRPRTGPVSRTW